MSMGTVEQRVPGASWRQIRTQGLHSTVIQIEQNTAALHWTTGPLYRP